MTAMLQVHGRAAAGIQGERDARAARLRDDLSAKIPPRRGPWGLAAQGISSEETSI